MAAVRLTDALDELEALNGKHRPHRAKHPFDQILYENAAYLVDDATRARVFASLKNLIGTTVRSCADGRAPDVRSVLCE